jgi:4-amino-4-deoxy-L-arabinose transferase-like glycosyltransferase
MKQYFILAVIVLAGIIPFSSRAVFMDEHIFLKIADNAQNNFWFPQDIPSVFFGIPMANFAAHTHPPVGEYYLAAIYRVIGHFSEVPFRLLFSLFPIAAVLAFYFVARRFTEDPFLVALLFALSPAFFVMAPTLMMDMPMLAFLLCGVALYFAYLEGHKYALGVATVCFILSAGTGYTALVPLGCLFISMLFARRPGKELLAVAAAPLALALWQVMMTVHFGAFPLAKTVAYYSGQSRVVRNVAAMFSFLGGVALFPWFVLIVSRARRKLYIPVAVGMATVAAFVAPQPSLAVRVWYVVLASSGILLIALFVSTARKLVASEKNAGEAFFILWVPATVLFFIVVADMINARYVILTLPALYLVVFRRTPSRQLRWMLVPTAVLSLCVAYSDFLFVNSYRAWVGKTVVPLQEAGFTFWGAAESGLRFYLEQRDIPTLTATDLRPRGADLVVSHDLFRYGLSEDLATMLTVLKREPLYSWLPLQTFNPRAGAGFHDSGTGLTPFSISFQPLDYVEIAQVSPFVDRLPQKGIPGEDIPAWSPQGVILKQDVDTLEFKLKLPGNCKLEYELVGRGTAELTADGIRLRRYSLGTIVWQRFRIVPAQLFREGN